MNVGTILQRTKNVFNLYILIIQFEMYRHITTIVIKTWSDGGLNMFWIIKSKMLSPLLDYIFQKVLKHLLKCKNYSSKEGKM